MAPEADTSRRLELAPRADTSGWLDLASGANMSRWLNLTPEVMSGQLDLTAEAGMSG